MIDSRPKFYGFLAVFMAIGAAYLAVAKRAIEWIMQRRAKHV